MNSKMFIGETFHQRLLPTKHSFRYPIWMFLFDIEELSELNTRLPFFGYNLKRLVSLHDRDYIDDSNRSLNDKIDRLLKEKGIDCKVEKTYLLTCPRFLNYVFNPVSFYYCLDADSKIVAFVAEVNNTFGERHLYVMGEKQEVFSSNKTNYRIKKGFYVSPFYDVDGEYDIKLSSLNGKTKIQMDLNKSNQKVFFSNLQGSLISLNQKSFWRTLAKYPLSIILNMPRIIWESSKMYYTKGIKVQHKPLALGRDTSVRELPNLYQRKSLQVLDSYLKNFDNSGLKMTMPNKEEVYYANADDAHADMRVYDYQFFPRVVMGSDVAFGEAYVDNLFDSSDLTKLIEFFIENKAGIDHMPTSMFYLQKAFSLFRHARRRNTKNGSKKNIRAHYDLSNELFELFLDPTMTYSSAFFENENETLEQAQFNKLDRVIKKAELSEKDHLLEIGSGWGSLAIRAAQTTGCRVTTVTLSREQLGFARKRISDLGLKDKISLIFCDYRDVKGSFDKIVSIEMLEAVGHQYYKKFFSKCDSLLKPSGKMVLQTISISNDRYHEAKKGADWIQQYIFPGSTIPSLEVLEEEAKSSSNFVLEDCEDIGIHYAKTLKIWQQCFNQNEQKVKDLGFDMKFIRMWRYYLSYCEAAFKTRYLGDLQLVFNR